MDRVERLVVQVAESNRLLAAGGPARWRISLLLLDNTAELILKLACDQLLVYNSSHRRHLEYVDAEIARGQVYEPPTPWDDDDDPPQKLLDTKSELEKQIVGDDELREIENYFDAKTAYLRRNGELTDSYVTILKRLHEYRNEAYHEDKIRPETIATAAKLYTYVVCDLMRNVRPIAISLCATPDLDALYPATSRGFDHDFLAPYADRLLADSPVSTPADLAEALSTHLTWRFDELDDNIDYIATRGDMSPKVTAEKRAATLVEIIGLKNAFNRRDDPTCKLIKSDYRQISRWRHIAKTIESVPSHVKAFEKYALIERPLEKIEEIVTEVVWALDDKIQDEIDVIRGK